MLLWGPLTGMEATHWTKLLVPGSRLGGTKCARGEVGVTVRRVIVKIEVTL